MLYTQWSVILWITVSGVLYCTILYCTVSTELEPMQIQNSLFSQLIWCKHLLVHSVPGLLTGLNTTVIKVIAYDIEEGEIHNKCRNKGKTSQTVKAANFNNNPIHLVQNMLGKMWETCGD